MTPKKIAKIARKAAENAGADDSVYSMVYFSVYTDLMELKLRGHNHRKKYRHKHRNNHARSA